MERIGVRKLRQDASELLRRVRAGETLEVTVRGRVVALLAPPPAGSPLARLEAEGRLTLPSRAVESLGPPCPAAPGVSLPSAALEGARELER